MLIKPKLFFFFILGGIAMLMLVIALYVPNSLPTQSDFSALYNTDLALVHRVPIYDLEEVEALAMQFSDIPPDKFFLARFPYPPWFALSTFYLGLMPAKAAATFWFELNLMMLFLAILFLTEYQSGIARVIVFVLALLFLPVLGALTVGQYDFPVLLGISILMVSLLYKDVTSTTVGMILLTFKPHIGALILLSALMYLIENWSNFGKYVMRLLLPAAAFLLITGFIADPNWIFSYPKMLLSYQSEGNVSACSECSSLPVFLSRWFFDGSLGNAVWIAVILLVFLVTIFFPIRKTLFKTSQHLLLTALFITLLVSPYLYNYDFLLLLVPLIVFVYPNDVVKRMIVAVSYVVPTVALILFGRAGNIALILVTIVLTAYFYIDMLRLRKAIIDFRRRAA